VKYPIVHNIRCIVVDDEPLALDLIKSYVEKTPFLELVSSCSSAFQAIKVMISEKVDLIFLDIQMQGLTGLDFSRSLKDGPKVIFTTAFSQFALEGFRVDALDYLVKPFNYPEFLSAANKALAWFRIISSEPGFGNHDYSCMMIKSGSKLVKIKLNTIMYIESMGDYVKISCCDREHPVISQATMKSLMERLPPGQFFRVHRSYIVNIDRVDIVERNRIIYNKAFVPVSESFREEFFSILNNKLLP